MTTTNPAMLALIERAIAGEPAPVVAETIAAYWGEGATALDIIAWFVDDWRRVSETGFPVDPAFYLRNIAKYAGIEP